MAAHRRNVPLRETAERCSVEDGTMCRMASPRPGPLRGETGDRLSEATISVDGARSRTSDSAPSLNTSALPMPGQMAA